jgi:hypothetical protein
LFTPRAKAALGRAAILLTASLGWVGAVNAAVYTGNWDPGYGGLFADLGWKATATFDVPDACLGQADGSYTIGGSCSGFTLLTAELDFYNYSADPNPDTSPVLESFVLGTGVSVYGVDITGGQLSGVSTNFFSAVVPGTGSIFGAGSSAIAGGGAYAFSLILDSSEAQLLYTKVGASTLCRSPGGAACGYSETAPIATFTPAIPEPETYALMLAGLAAIGVVKRRKSR